MVNLLFSYEVNRQSEEDDSRIKLQDFDFKIHQVQFDKTKRSKNSEAIELQDYDDSSDEEKNQRKHLPNKQELNKFKLAQKHSTQEEPDYITEPMNRQHYEERKIKKSHDNNEIQSNDSKSKFGV